jgi:hypothetical protein
MEGGAGNGVVALAGDVIAAGTALAGLIPFGTRFGVVGRNCCSARGGD